MAVHADTENRTFYIHDDIDSRSVSEIIFGIVEILREDSKKDKKVMGYKRKPIKLYINTNGGIVQDMWSLVDVLSSSKTPVHTYCTGYAHSCGFLIFIAGDKRYITKHTSMICHQPSTWLNGTYQDIKEQVVDLDRLWKDLEEYICCRTNITKARLHEVREKKIDWCIYSEESIGLGVATDILSKM